MPQIGWFEILIVVAVAIVVIGPKDFPLMLKKVGSWIGTIKKYVTNFQNEISILDDDTIDIETSTLKQEKKNIDKKNEQK
jgi:sec-independent protein translocase protein TatB|tara:strand:+ start:132 stop:371 length:240 start_codon:yes stop_codon:yes gene_type:complete